MIANATDVFEQALQENLSLYTLRPTFDSKDFFQCYREINIARFALETQAKAYFQAIEILTQILHNIAQQPNHTDRDITNVMQIISSIETKSKSLISSAKDIASLLGQAVSIDVDKAALRTMISNLPSLVQQSITTVTNNPDLAQQIAISLNSQISELMVAFRFADTTILQQSDQSSEDVSLVTYQEMINSVPSHDQR